MEQQSSSVNAFVKSLKASTQPTGKQFVWGKDPEDDPEVIRYRSLVKEAKNFASWDQSSKVQLTSGVSIKESIGQELNRSIARAPNLTEPSQDKLFAGGWAVADMNDEQEFKAFRSKYFTYANRTKIMNDLTRQMLPQQFDAVKQAAQKVHIGDQVGGIVPVLPGIIGMLQNSVYFPSSSDAEPEDYRWLMLAVVGAFVAAVGWLGVKSYKNYEEGIKRRNKKILDDALGKSRKGNEKKIEKRSEEAEEAFDTSQLIDLNHEREAELQKEEVHGRIMRRAIEMKDIELGLPAHHDPETNRRTIERGSLELKKHIEGYGFVENAVFKDLASVMLKGDVFQIAEYLRSSNLEVERLRKLSQRSSSKRDSNLLNSWVSLNYKDPFSEQSDFWF